MNPPAPAREKWLVYSTFDAEGAGPGFCADQLQAYRDAGFRTIVVDSSPVISAERERLWQSLATHWLQRENIGYDFGSYRAGVEYLTRELGRDPADISLLLANDSCYGPYTPLDQLFAHFDVQPLGERRVFGITDSRYYGYHLQSYWLYFRPEVTPLAVAFFDSMETIVDRTTAVQFGEIGLSRLLLEQGCRLVVPFTSEQIVAAARSPRFGRHLSFLEFGLRKVTRRYRYTKIGDGVCMRDCLGHFYGFNPTAAFGIHMHVTGMSPFLKRQLIRENPNGDRLIPASLAGQKIVSNEAVFRAIRQSPLFAKRYGAAEAARPYAGSRSIPMRPPAVPPPPVAGQGTR